VEIEFIDAAADLAGLLPELWNFVNHAFLLSKAYANLKNSTTIG
jgi:hypothetical protein